MSVLRNAAHSTHVTRTLAYRHFRESVVHLYTECPEGSIIGIARRVAIHDESAMQGLEWCPWCAAQDCIDKSRQEDT